MSSSREAVLLSKAITFIDTLIDEGMKRLFGYPILGHHLTLLLTLTEVLRTLYDQKQNFLSNPKKINFNSFGHFSFEHVMLIFPARGKTSKGQFKRPREDHP